MRRLIIPASAVLFLATLLSWTPVATAAPVMRVFLGGVWSDPAAWSPTGVPKPGDSVTINAANSYFDTPGLQIQDLELVFGEFSEFVGDVGHVGQRHSRVTDG